MAVEDEFEILTPTEVTAEFQEIDTSDAPKKVRKLCACGCGEEVSGNRALKRGHTMGEGLSASVFGGNDILVFQAGFVTLVSAIFAGLHNKKIIPVAMESEEAEGIGEPLGRIAARHIPKAVLRRLKPGDTADAIAVISTMAAFTIRSTTMPKEAKVIPVATNGYNSDFSGLGQYAYRPPEQNVQPQNGSSN